MFNDISVFQAHHRKTDLNYFNKPCVEHRSEASDLFWGSSLPFGFVKLFETSIDDHFDGRKKVDL